MEYLVGAIAAMAKPPHFDPPNVRASSKAGGSKVADGEGEAEVEKAYSKVRSAEDSVAGECFVAGSIYGGLIFDLKEGVVTRIFIGAAAE